MRHAGEPGYVATGRPLEQVVVALSLVSAFRSRPTRDDGAVAGSVPAPTTAASSGLGTLLCQLLRGVSGAGGAG